MTSREGADSTGTGRQTAAGGWLGLQSAVRAGCKKR